MMTPHLLPMESNFLVPNGTFFVELIAFAFMFFILAKYIVPPINRAMTARQDAIRQQFEELDQAKEEANSAKDEFQSQIEEARHEAARIREDAREQGAAIIAEMREQAQSEASRIVEHGKAQIEAERQAAVASLRTEVGTLATTLAGRIVGESLDDDARQGRVVERFLADLESGTAGRQLMLSFRAASKEAVDALVDQVGGSATVADDLFSVAATLRSEPALRRFATDSALATEAKAGLVSELYDGKVDSATLGLLKDAVGRRWTRTRDLADALEYVGVVAAVRSSGDDADQLVDELFAVRTLVDDNTDLRAALADHARSAADKAVLVDTLLGGKVLPATVILVKQALSGGARSVAAALEDYEKVAADVHGRDVATVQVARPLDDERRAAADSGAGRALRPSGPPQRRRRPRRHRRHQGRDRWRRHRRHHRQPPRRRPPQDRRLTGTSHT